MHNKEQENITHRTDFTNLGMSGEEKSSRNCAGHYKSTTQTRICFQELNAKNHVVKLEPVQPTIPS